MRRRGCRGGEGRESGGEGSGRSGAKGGKMAGHWSLRRIYDHRKVLGQHNLCMFTHRRKRKGLH